MKHMISIWFFIGCLLTIYGFLIFYAGIGTFSAAAAPTASLRQLHLPLWWGIAMIALGIVYLVHFRPRR
jgi:uncharacterized membrane protein YkvI